MDTREHELKARTQDLADTEDECAQATGDIEGTRNSLAGDEQFLMMLKVKCSITDKECEVRQKTRQLEMEAVSKALPISSRDDAHGKRRTE